MKLSSVVDVAIYASWIVGFLIVLYMTWRPTLFAIRLTAARHKALAGGDVHTRWFGRAQTAYCAHILVFRRSRGSRILKPGGFFAKRVMSAVRKAAEVAVVARDLSTIQADHWQQELHAELFPAKTRQQQRTEPHRQRESRGNSFNTRDNDRHTDVRGQGHRRPHNSPVRDLRPRRVEVPLGGFEQERRASAAPVFEPKPAVTEETLRALPPHAAIGEPPDFPHAPFMDEPPDGFVEEVDESEVVEILGADRELESRTRLAR